MATGIKVIAQYYDIETGESLEEEVLALILHQNN